MTRRLAFGRAAVTLLGLTLAVVLPVSLAHAAHCDSDELSSPPPCAEGHVVVDQLITADPECDPLAGPAPEDLDALADWCDPAWSTDVTQVAATYDANVASMLASIRVVLAVGFSVLLLFTGAVLVLTAVAR